MTKLVKNFVTTFFIWKTSGQYYKTFYGRNFINFRNKLVFVPVKPSQPSIMFAFMTTAGLERLARDKRSSLLQKIVTYGRRKFYNIGHGRKNFCEKRTKTGTDSIKKSF